MNPHPPAVFLLALLDALAADRPDAAARLQQLAADPAAFDHLLKHLPAA